MTSEQLHRGNAILNKMQAIESDLIILAEIKGKPKQTSWRVTDASGKPMGVPIPMSMFDTLMEELVKEKEESLKSLQSQLESL